MWATKKAALKQAKTHVCICYFNRPSMVRSLLFLALKLIYYFFGMQALGQGNVIACCLPRVDSGEYGFIASIDNEGFSS